MMLYYYSAVKNAFFPDELKDAYQNAGNWPQDAAEVEESVFTTYSASPPQGKQRAAGKNGLPCWVDIPLPDIEDARSQKHTEINAWRDQQENGSTTFDWNGHKWDAGKASQDRLAPVLIVAKSSQLPPGFFWTDASNEDVPVTVDDLTAIDAGMTQAMVVQGFKIHERQRQMKKDISELTKVSDILNYPVGWSDNSGN
ncbi:DUF4376 domain-containing protein [Salmonella enterica]|nr:DUF4376 domain-containing protein [Salmonella enterica]EBP3855874.1 DUF4376 domain-containing protein [Salmonella enterica subsp. enterica]EAW9842600.1 DUF4376 domain-containing protein [Salmonella enterica]EAW9874096.1 DUF4376 domain-containing protein [Salmonella enterica]EAY4929296.1 DUF4376 domain-containing protein [Salmonella enterica]